MSPTASFCEKMVPKKQQDCENIHGNWKWDKLHMFPWGVWGVNYHLCISPLTHDWFHSMWLTALSTQLRITSEHSGCCQADFTHCHANVRELLSMPGWYTCLESNQPDLEGAGSRTLIPSPENTQTKSNDSVNSLPSNAVTRNKVRKTVYPKEITVLETPEQVKRFFFCLYGFLSKGIGAETWSVEKDSALLSGFAWNWSLVHPLEG